MNMFVDKKNTLSTIGSLATRLVTSVISGAIVRVVKSVCRKYFKISRKKINYLKFKAHVGDSEGPFLVYVDGKVVGFVGGPPGEEASGQAQMEEWFRQMQAQSKPKEDQAKTATSKVKPAKVSKGKR